LNKIEINGITKAKTRRIAAIWNITGRFLPFVGKPQLRQISSSLLFRVPQTLQGSRDISL